MPSNTAPSFAIGGTALTDLTGGVEFSRKVLIQPDGKFIVGGSWTPDGGTDAFLVSRFNADGTLDTTFGSGGYTLVDIFFNDFCEGMALQADGKILLTGADRLIRFNSDGTLDTSFNGSGYLFTEFDFFGSSRSVAVQSDGKIVVGGFAYPDGVNADFALWRYNAGRHG